MRIAILFMNCHCISGLRALQGRKELEKLVKRVKNTRDQMQWGSRGPPPLLIKLAPDLTDADKSDVATVCLRLGVDGLVVSNTTITRPGAVADHPTGSEVGYTPPHCWYVRSGRSIVSSVSRRCCHAGSEILLVSL